jgi:hypothetical protein
MHRMVEPRAILILHIGRNGQHNGSVEQGSGFDSSL